MLLSMLALVLVLANLPGSAGARQAAAAPRWRTLVNQGFESDFPAGNWTTTDVNGPSVGVPPPGTGATVQWDDTSVRANNGFWSAHPNDSTTYSNLTDTWMKYGPINLTGARNARVLFSYSLDTEKFYDFFAWEYSCRNDGTWRSTAVSGGTGAWVNATMPLAECVGSNNVYVRWSFRSDYSNPATPGAGVYLDDVRIQKYA